MAEFFIATAIIIALFAIALSRERHRERLLRAWVAHHPGASLRRRAEFPHPAEFPAEELAKDFLGRAAIGFASAMRVPREEGALWLAEYRSTPTGAKTDRWFTMAALRFPDEVSAAAFADGRPEVFVSGPYACLHLPGLITLKTLEGLSVQFPTTTPP